MDVLKAMEAMRAMSPEKRPKNDFGGKVGDFCDKNAITIQALTHVLKVNYGTTLDAMNGRSAGHEVKPVIERFIDDYNNTYGRAQGV